MRLRWILIACIALSGCVSNIATSHYVRPPGQVYRYGNFCGVGHPGFLADDAASPPDRLRQLIALPAVDDIDRACKFHDICYELAAPDSKACDEGFSDLLGGGLFGQGPTTFLGGPRLGGQCMNLSAELQWAFMAAGKLDVDLGGAAFRVYSLTASASVTAPSRLAVGFPRTPGRCFLDLEANEASRLGSGAMEHAVGAAIAAVECPAGDLACDSAVRVRVWTEDYPGDYVSFELVGFTAPPEDLLASEKPVRSVASFETSYGYSVYYAHRLLAHRLAVLERRLAEGDADPSVVARAYGELAYLHVMRRKEDEAIDAAERGLALDPSQAWIAIPMSHALFLDDRPALAEALYERYRGETAPELGGASWVDVAREDVERLRAMANFTSPHYDRVLSALAP